MLFSNYDSAKYWLDSTGIVEINGEQADTINIDESDLVKRGFDFKIVAHSTSPLNKRYFIREQIKDVLMAGNDIYDNSLVIDYEGNLKLIPLINRSPISLSEYPVRFETFQAGNGYVGNIDDFHFLETTYMALLEA